MPHTFPFGFKIKIVSILRENSSCQQVNDLDSKKKGFIVEEEKVERTVLFLMFLLRSIEGRTALDEP